MPAGGMSSRTGNTSTTLSCPVEQSQIQRQEHNQALCGVFITAGENFSPVLPICCLQDPKEGISEDAHEGSDGSSPLAASPANSPWARRCWSYSRSQLLQPEC